jgi:hypothetical protein
LGTPAESSIQIDRDGLQFSSLNIAKKQNLGFIHKKFIAQNLRKHETTCTITSSGTLN